jgi:recombination protein RecA
MYSAAAALDLSFIAADVAPRRPPATADTFAIPGVRPASALEIRPAPDMLPFGIPALDALTGGVPRGALTEMVGPASSGRTSVMLALMAEVTRRQEVCALVDVTDSFDPVSAEAAGVDLRRMLWVRCGQKRESWRESCDINPGDDRSRSAPRPQNAIGQTREDSNAERVHQAITSGCFEPARGRREFTAPATLNKVAPPAKNISWSIHENYDSRLRHAMVNGRESYKRREPWNANHAAVQAAVKRNMNTHFAEARRAKWDRLDQALKATDLLLQSGGFGLVIVDLGDISIEQARRIPLTSWFRFRRVVESTPTILMVLAKDSCAKTCASLVMQLSADARRSGESQAESSLTHVSLLDGLNVRVELLCTRLERKPVASVAASLETRTLWKRTG